MKAALRLLVCCLVAAGVRAEVPSRCFGALEPDAPCAWDGVLRLRIDILDDEVPAYVRVRITSRDGKSWETKLTGQQIVVRLPRGPHELVAEAPRFLPYRTSVQIAEAPLPLTVELRPLRVIDGLIVERESHAAIAGAQVESDTGVHATAGRDGRFALEIDPERWPGQLTVRAKGYGTRIVPVPRARASTSLDNITLSRGVTVVAQIHQTEPGQVSEVELLKLRNNGRAPDIAVQTVSFVQSDAVDRTLRFEHVEPGEYVVLAKGARPWQRAGTRIDVPEREPPPVHVQLSPFRMRLRAVGDDMPLRNSRVILRHQEVFWEARFPMDGEGEADIELWQPGLLTATVDSSGSVPFRIRRTLTDATDTEWVLQMPRLEVVGTVVDAKTGAPIPHPKLALDMRSPERSQLAVTVDGEADGTFRFAPVMAGEHELQAAAAGYPVGRFAYTFETGEETRKVTIALAREPRSVLVVTDARGIPVVNADVHLFDGVTSVAFTKTGTDGTAHLFIPEGDTRDVYVVPRDGSLGVARVVSGTPAVSLSLPPGRSRIVVRTEAESHAVRAGVMIDVSYNGFLLPDDVMEALVARGSRVISDASGRIVLQQMPPGAYELRPVSMSTRAPVRVVAVPGENVAVMTVYER